MLCETTSLLYVRLTPLLCYYSVTEVKILCEPPSGDVMGAFDRYTRVGNHLRDNGGVPLQSTVHRIYESKNSPKEFALLDGPTGVGKSQQFFALHTYKVVYLVVSSWVHGGDALEQNIYKAFAPLSRAFKECVRRDVNMLTTSMPTSESKGIVSTESLASVLYKKLESVGLVLAVLKFMNVVETCRVLSKQVDGSLNKFVIQPATINDVIVWVLSNPHHNIIFAVDELPPTEDMGATANTFCRSLFRVCGLTVVLAGTDSTLKNAFTGSDVSRGERQHAWAELQVRMSPPTLESVKIVCPTLPDGHWTLPLILSSRPLLAIELAMAVCDGGRVTDTVDGACLEVAKALFMKKLKLRNNYGLLGQWLMFEASYLKGANVGKTGGALIASHMADLDIAEDAEPLVFYVRAGILCLGSAETKWAAKCSFRGPGVEPLLYLVLQGTIDQASANTSAFMLRRHEGNWVRLTTVQALKCIESLGDLQPIIKADHSNPNAPGSDGKRLESLATTAWCVASHEMGIRGSSIDTFFCHLCTELSSDEKWDRLSMSDTTLSEYVGGDVDLRMPYMFPPGVAVHGVQWVLPASLQGMGGCFGQLERPANQKEHDIRMLLPTDVSPDVILCAGESKDYTSRLNATELSECIERIPADVRLHFIFCNVVSDRPFSKSAGKCMPESFKIRNPQQGGPDTRSVAMYIARRSKRVVCLERVKGGACGIPDVIVVVIALAHLAAK